MPQVKKGVLFLGIAVVACLAAAVKFLLPSKDGIRESERAVSAVPAPMTDKNGASVANETQMNRTLTLTTAYKNPAGEDEVGFTVVVDSMGVIVDASAQVLATNNISKKRQEAFAEGFPAALKGKKLSLLSAIDRVGGSSLTTAAFNQSIDELKAQ